MEVYFEPYLNHYQISVQFHYNFEWEARYQYVDNPQCQTARCSYHLPNAVMLLPSHIKRNEAHLSSILTI